MSKDMRAIAIPVILLTLVACGGGFDPAEPTPPDSGDDDRTTIDRGDPNAEKVPESMRPPVTGEVPDEIMEAILEDAVTRTGLSRAELEVERAEAVTWSDGSLGCPQPGEFYTQALVDGYWVELSGPEVWLDYRVDDRGIFKLCENRLDPSGDAEGSGEQIGPPGGSPDA